MATVTQTGKESFVWKERGNRHFQDMENSFDHYFEHNIFLVMTWCKRPTFTNLILSPLFWSDPTGEIFCKTKDESSLGNIRNDSRNKTKTILCFLYSKSLTVPNLTKQQCYGEQAKTEKKLTKLSESNPKGHILVSVVFG